ncbi:MAG: hypothetical protein K0S25_2145 [Bacillus sp. (in: firmicutes)]|jgi:hypothetical protein|nr:hypothetical protein [Bacillus sp. (in: firmicutes)]
MDYYGVLEDFVMIQRFIELGEGYSDLYELIEIAKSNQHRLLRMMAFHSVDNGKDVTSLAVILNPTNPGNFQPIYLSREGIPNPNILPNKRFNLFRETAEQLQKNVIELTVKPSSEFAEKELFYQYLIGILRMNRYIPFLH